MHPRGIFDRIQSKLYLIIIPTLRYKIRPVYTKKNEETLYRSDFKGEQPMSTELPKGVVVEDKLDAISIFVDQLKSATSLSAKLAIVNSQAIVDTFLSSSKDLESILQHLNPEHELIVKVLIALGQGPLFFSQLDQVDHTSPALHSLLDQLLVVETFYNFMGGLAGYYQKTLTLIIDKQKVSQTQPNKKYYRPPGIDISSDTTMQRSAIRRAIESLPFLAHMCPIGGAGERLNLLDEMNGEPLPVAFLQFGTYSLFEGIVMDLQAIEFLYWKIHAIQLTVPVALMTSHERNNHTRIKNFCQKMNYFGRKAENFRQFLQPLIPVVTEEGDFALTSPLHLLLKPSGHGVIWRLAIENNIITWFESLGKSKLLMRQINNPIAGMDGGIWALVGIGSKYRKKFGFLSCDRLIKASEGMLALEESSTDSKFRYCITNIEYTDFASKGLTDTPKEEGSPYSAFPANTNILFADIQTLKEFVALDPVPGIMINMKNKYKHIDANGTVQESHGGRLESMMQNISDLIVDTFPKSSLDYLQEHLRCFLVYNKRQKVISVTKNKYVPEKPIAETPIGCFYDQMCNTYDLFKNYCHLLLPELQSPEDFLQQGPSCIIRYHPALGPVYHVISQKIRNGNLTVGSELQLDIAELDIANLSLEGSLHIIALDPLGHKDQEGTLQYCNQNGKCELKNVTVSNRGIDKSAKNTYWKNEITHHEQLVIVLHGNAEFFASDVALIGDMRLEVPPGHRMEVTMHDGTIRYHTFEIVTPTWEWHYAFDDQDAIKLNKII